MSTRPNYFRSEDAYLGVAKDLQKLTIAESIKNAGQRRVCNCHTSWRAE